MTLRKSRNADRQSGDALEKAPFRFRDVVKTMSACDTKGIPGAVPLGRTVHSILVLILAVQIPMAFREFKSEKPTAKVHQNTFVWRNRESALSAARAKQQLLQIAENVEGPFLAPIEDIVDAVETGDHPFSVADDRIYEFRPDRHQFARETIAAYEVWKAATIREMHQR